MSDENLQKGELVTYGHIKYKIIDNKIVKGDKKRKTIMKINAFSVLIMIFVYLIYFAATNILGGNDTVFNFEFMSFFISFVIIFAGFVLFIVAHEYMHYLSYRISGTPKDKLKFGVILKSGLAYCISLVPNTLKASRLSLMMPFYVLVIPCIILSIFLKNNLLGFMSALFASGSAGDFWYMWSMHKIPKDMYIVEVMPKSDGYEIGYLVLEKI